MSAEKRLRNGEGFARVAYGNAGLAGCGGQVGLPHGVLPFNEAGLCVVGG